MRFSFSLINSLAFASSLWVGGVVAKTSTGNGFAPALFGALPECGSPCLYQVAENYACDANTTSCVCTDKHLVHALETCFSVMCPSLEAVVSLKVHSLACDAPVRNRTPLMVGVTTTLFAIASIMVLLRVAARCPWIGGPGYGPDDYTIFFAYLASVVVYGMCLQEHVLGFGQDIFDLTIPDVTKFAFYFYIIQIMYTIPVFASKASMVLLYMRTWPAHGKWTVFHVICWLTIGSVIIAALFTVFVTSFYCHPLDAAWSLDKRRRQSQCLDLSTNVFAVAAMSIFLDIVILMLPIANLVELPISIRQRVALCTVFMAGVIVTVIAIIRLHYISNVSVDVVNATYELSIIGLWSSVEIYLSIICVCIPAATGFIRRLCGPRDRFPSFSRSSKTLNEDETQLRILSDSRLSGRQENSYGKGHSP